MRDVAGKRVVVTGKIAGESRGTAEGKLRDAGAIVQASVGRKTDVLVTGGDVGKTKLDAARKFGAEVIPWEIVWRSTAPASSWEEIAQDPLEEADFVRVRDEVKIEVPSIVPGPQRAYGPMLAKAGDIPRGPDWLYEVKWDGLRCLARVADGALTMTSRSAKSDYVDRFPQIAALLAQWPDVVLDGELVVLDDRGRSSLGSISNRAGAKFIVFDVLELMGNDLTKTPLKARRRVLEDTLFDVFKVAGGDRIAVSPTFDNPDELMEIVGQEDLEGMIAKQRSGLYLEGSRSWIKIKRRNQQEFVVLGWVPGKGGLAGSLGGLVLGVRENDAWLYVGRVGTGLDDHGRRRMLERLEPLERDRHPEIETGKATRAELREVVWVEPEVVVEVAFQLWSEDRRLIIPSIKRLREDKEAIEVTAQA